MRLILMLFADKMSLGDELSCTSFRRFSLRELLARVDNVMRANLDFVRIGVGGPMTIVGLLSLCERRQGEHLHRTIC